MSATSVQGVGATRMVRPSFARAGFSRVAPGRYRKAATDNPDFAVEIVKVDLRDIGSGRGWEIQYLKGDPHAGVVVEDSEGLYARLVDALAQSGPENWLDGTEH